MKKFCFLFSISALCLVFATVTHAQLLDDDYVDDTKQSEALFDEMFGEFSETDKDINKTPSFDDVISETAKLVSKAEAEKEKEKEQKQQLTGDVMIPLSGELTLGIVKGSFRIFRKMTGRMSCSFDVILQSTLDRDLKVMGFSLIYKQGTFAFIFKNLPTNGSQIHSITTSGNICYNLEGEPDIEVNLCKIRNAPGSECAKRLKWSDDITPVETPNQLKL